MMDDRLHRNGVIRLRLLEFMVSKCHVTILCLVSCFLCLNAQTHIILRNSGLQNGKPSVQIKWFSQNVVQEKPIYLFRKETSEKDWKLLRAESFKIQNTISNIETARDKELETFVEIVKARKQKPINGIMMIALWVKAIESIPFADFLGIHYNDTTAQFGKTYQYCLRYSNNPYDPHIVIAQEVKVSEQETLLAPVANFKLAVVGKKEIGFLWKPENIRFWAVNIYRKRSYEGDFKRITNKPLIINEYQSADPQFKREFFATDDSLKEGGLYFYKIIPLDFFGKEGESTTEFNIFLPDKSSPEPVILKKDSAYKQTVWLSWTKCKAKDLKGYHVYRSQKNDADFKRITTEPLTSLSFIDKPKDAGDYYYFASSIDTANNENPSNKVIANLDDVTPPAVPKGLSIKADTGKIKLSWNANTEKDLWGYYIYRGMPKQAKTAFVLLTKRPFKGTMFIDTLNKVARNRFVYAVAAVDTSFNVSELSDTLGAAMPDIIPPDKPYIKTVLLQNGTISVTWLAGNEKDLAGFELFVSASSPQNDPSMKASKPFSQRIAPDQRTLTITNPFEGAKTYSVHMTAIDLKGNISEKSDVYVQYADESKAKEQDLGKLKLSATFKKKQKEVAIKWKHEGKSKASKYLLYAKNNEGEYKPASEYLKEEKLRIPVSSKGTFTYQLRGYFTDGRIIKSEEITIEIKEK